MEKKRGEWEFLETYKRLEQQCRAQYGSVSGYIAEMEKRNASYSVSGWKEDLRRLKHLRWARNKLAHEAGVSYEKICDGGNVGADIQWLEDFRKRMAKKADPLSRLAALGEQREAARRAALQSALVARRKATVRPRPASEPQKKKQRAAIDRKKEEKRENRKKTAVYIAIFVLLLLIGACFYGIYWILIS